MSFDVSIRLDELITESLNPFGTGQCLSTVMGGIIQYPVWVSIPLEQGSVFRLAVGEDGWTPVYVSIPLEQGSVFRPLLLFTIIPLACVSIPLEQGSVFRHGTPRNKEEKDMSLNPFGTGQCLSTK